MMGGLPQGKGHLLLGESRLLHRQLLPDWGRVTGGGDDDLKLPLEGGRSWIS